MRKAECASLFGLGVLLHSLLRQKSLPHRDRLVLAHGWFRKLEGLFTSVNRSTFGPSAANPSRSPSGRGRGYEQARLQSRPCRCPRRRTKSGWNGGAANTPTRHIPARAPWCLSDLLVKKVIDPACSYLKLTGYRLGLLINSNVPTIKRGIQRVVP